MDPTPKTDNPQSHDPVPVEIVFQGGGAKLAALLAAAEALRQAESDRKIKITGITGTSAGAIAGCLLAVPPNGDKGFQNIIHELWLEGMGLELLNRAKPQWWGKDWATLDYWRNQNLPQLRWRPWRWPGLFSKVKKLTETAGNFWSGKPLWDTEPFERWLAAQLGTTARLNEFKPPVRVTRTDLKACVSETVKDGIAWREAMNSAAFPFLLRLWSEGYVDGGICENLPVEAMTNGAIILAFTFPVQDPSEPRSGQTHLNSK
jgi:predicted acylesterase/phospholipase RssA